MTRREAADRLGVTEAEIASVRDTIHGPVATLTDGREYVITDAGNLALNPEGDVDG